MTINSKNTKAEILAAYKELEKANQRLESTVKEKMAKVNSVNNTDNKRTTTNLLPNLKNIPLTIQFLEQLQHGFGGAVGNLSERLIIEATKLDEIRENISNARNKLEALHGIIEIEPETIEELLAVYQENAQQFSEEIEQQQNESQQEIEALIKSWQKEQESYLREIKLRNELAKKEGDREAEEYEYNLSLARELDEAEYKQEQKLLHKELAETRAELEQQWQQREAEIAKQEKDYREAKEKVATFEAELVTKVDRGREEGKGIGSYQAKVRADLRNKEIAGARQNYQLQTQALEQTIGDRENRIERLSQQLESSLQQVQNLAVKAIEGTSNRNSFEAMKQIALEQAKTQTKGK